MTNYPLVSVNLVVKDGEKYIKACLEAVRRQNYPNLEVIVFDNDSRDKTKEIVRKKFPEFRLVENSRNYYPGGGFNRSIGQSKGKYALALCVDVFLDENFIKNAVERMESDEKIGALQAKILRHDPSQKTSVNIIDTTGFQIFRSRRIVNRGHGDSDTGQFEKAEEIFSYEGAAGFFRRETLEDAKIDGQIFDEDFVWYADDVDLGWRLTLLGWKNFYDPKVIARHDRSTTKRTSEGYTDFISLRKTLPAAKKRWDYANQRLTMLKNELPMMFLGDLPPFLMREVKLWIYFILFEQSSIPALADIARLAPRMIKKRKKIMLKKRISAEKIKKWFN